ncbi:hypothetical protein GCM10027610_142240 [Dactylosporangium cerinum]
MALTGLWALSGAHFFWPAIPLFFLVLSVFKHARWRRWAAAGVRRGGAGTGDTGTDTVHGRPRQTGKAGAEAPAPPELKHPHRRS